MKPGDKVWVWNNYAHEIQEVTISCLGFEKSSDIINTRKGRIYTALVWHAKNGTLDYSIKVPCKYCFSTREALCEHYRKILNDMEMKVDWKIGDRCWYFDNHYKVICSAIIKNIDYNVIEARDEHTGMLVGFDEHTLPFPTREELCEHYRKIFE